MARIKWRSEPTNRTVAAGYLARRIEKAADAGMTQREIAQAAGINERTVRKILKGETSGKRVLRKSVTTVKTAEPGTWTIVVTGPGGRKTGIDISAPGSMTKGGRTSKFDQLAVIAEAERRGLISSELARKRGGSGPWSSDEIDAAEILTAKPITVPHYAGVPVLWT